MMRSLGNKPVDVRGRSHSSIDSQDPIFKSSGIRRTIDVSRLT